LKPIDPQRLAKTLDWLRFGDGRPRQKIPGMTEPLLRIPCCGHQRIFFIPIGEVEYVHTDLVGIHVVSADKQGVTELALKTLQERSSLIRCHRQYLVNPDRIGEIALRENGVAEIVTSSGKRIPASRRHLRELKDRLLVS
jgi:two-component system LytT family response regulator